MKKTLQTLAICLASTACAQLETDEILNPQSPVPNTVARALTTERLRTSFAAARAHDANNQLLEATRQYGLVLIEKPDLDLVRFRRAYLDYRLHRYISADAHITRLRNLGHRAQMAQAVRELEQQVDVQLAQVQ